MWWMIFFNKWLYIGIVFIALAAVVGVQYIEIGHQKNLLGQKDLQITSVQNQVDSLKLQVGQCNAMVTNQRALQTTMNAIQQHSVDIKKKIGNIIISVQRPDTKGEVKNDTSAKEKGENPVGVANTIVDDFNNRMLGK